MNNTGVIEVDGVGVDSALITTGNVDTSVILDNSGTIIASNGSDCWGVDAGLSLTGTNSGTIQADNVALGTSFDKMDVTNSGKIEALVGSTAIAAGMYCDSDDIVTNAKGGEIIGNVNMYAGSDTFNVDVDSILNGQLKNVENVNVTGISSLTTDVAGAKTIVGSVDDVLASASIDGVAADLNGTKVQIAGAATAETTDDIWASLTKNSDDSLTVAWGRSEEEVTAALDAFKADNTLSIGDAVVATATTLDDADTTNDFSKKENGKLA